MPRTKTCLVLLAFLLIPAQVTCGALFINDVVRDKNYVEWPGLVEVLRGPGQFRSYTGAGNEIFFYRGSSAQLNEVLQKFAAVDIPVHDVILLPGPARTQTLGFNELSFGWRLDLLREAPPSATESEATRGVKPVYPTLTVYIGDGKPVEPMQVSNLRQFGDATMDPNDNFGQINLDEIAIPDSVTLLQREEVRERCYRNLETAPYYFAAQKLAVFDYDISDSCSRVLDAMSDGTQISGLAYYHILARFGQPVRPFLLKELERKDLDSRVRDDLNEILRTLESVQPDPELTARRTKLTDEIEAFVDKHRAETDSARKPQRAIRHGRRTTQSTSHAPSR